VDYFLDGTLWQANQLCAITSCAVRYTAVDTYLWALYRFWTP
jgi:hypothetical protein